MTATYKTNLKANCMEVYYAVLAKAKIYAKYGDHRSVDRQQASERVIELEESPIIDYINEEDFDSLFADKLWLENILPAAKAFNALGDKSLCFSLAEINAAFPEKTKGIL